MWMYNRLSGEVKPNCLKYRVFGNYASVVSEDPFCVDDGGANEQPFKSGALMAW